MLHGAHTAPARGRAVDFRAGRESVRSCPRVLIIDPVDAPKAHQRGLPMTIPSVQLSDGHSIPQIGLGTALDDQAIVPVIVDAVEAGFRHIDTAYPLREPVGRGARHPRQWHRAGGAVRHHEVGRRVPRGLSCRCRPRRVLATARHGLRRSVADPLAAAAARRVRLHVEDLRAAGPAGQGTVDRRLQLQAGSSGPAPRRSDDSAGGQSDPAQSPDHP